MYIQGWAIQYEQYILKCAGATMAGEGISILALTFCKKLHFQFPIAFLWNIYLVIFETAIQKKHRLYISWNKSRRNFKALLKSPPSMILMTTTTSANPNPPSWQWPKVNICDGGVHQEFMLTRVLAAEGVGWWPVLENKLLTFRYSGIRALGLDEVVGWWPVRKNKLLTFRYSGICTL